MPKKGLIGRRGRMKIGGDVPSSEEVALWRLNAAEAPTRTLEECLRANKRRKIANVGSDVSGRRAEKGLKKIVSEVSSQLRDRVSELDRSKKSKSLPRAMIEEGSLVNQKKLMDLYI